VRFAEDQRRKREWINFAEIADWCSEVDGSVVPNESARASAYEKLQRDLLEGDFEENGRSRVLYLHPWTVKAKVTRQWMENMIETHPLRQFDPNISIIAGCHETCFSDGSPSIIYRLRRRDSSH
jgi:hypothetical protein